MAGFGIGFGAFAAGLNQGVNAGLKLGKAYEENKTVQNRKDQIAAAKTDYDNAVGADMQQQADQYSAGDTSKPFDMEGAQTKAKQKIGSFTDFLYNQKMPQIVDNLVSQGDLTGAETLRKWAQDGKERSFMTEFGKTLGTWHEGQATGDYTNFAESAVKLLNKGGYGMTATGYDFVKDGDGKTTGITFKLKDEEGKESSHTFNSMDEAASFLAAQGSPENRVKQWMSQQEAAAKFKATVATEQAKAQIGIGKETAVENAKQKNRLELQERKADDQLRLEATKNKGGANKEQQTNDYVIGLLRERGFTDDDVNTYIAGKYLGEAYRKGKSPREFAQQLVLELSKDPMNAGKSRDEILKQAQSLVDIANEIGGQNGGPQTPRAPKQQNFPVYR